MSVTFTPSYLSLNIAPSPCKKRRLEQVPEKCAPSLEAFSMKPQEVARKKFFENLSFEWLSCGSDQLTQDVYVISSDQQGELEKIRVKVKAFMACGKKYPGSLLNMKWVDVPNEGFFKKENFEKVTAAIYGIPFHSRIFIQTGDMLITPKAPEKVLFKKPSKPTFPDQIICYDPYDSPLVAMAFKFLNAMSPIPYYYFTSSESFGRLTYRSIVYFRENERLVQQSPDVLVSRGFRVVGALPKKQPVQSPFQAPFKALSNIP
jgi:hypothetical protein